MTAEQSPSIWYRNFLKEVKRKHGEDWIDQLPKELQQSVLAIHQAALDELAKIRLEKGRKNEQRS